MPDTGALAPVFGVEIGCCWKKDWQWCSFGGRQGVCA